MFEFTLKIDPAVAELLGLDGDSIIEAFYDPDEDEIVIRVLDEDELDGEFNDPPCNGCPLFCQEHGICLAKTIADLDWTNKKSRSSLEMSDPTSRPAIAKKRDNMDEYDTIFVEFPIWWYIAPTIVNAFLESYDLTGKTIIPFATSGGSGMGKTNEALKPSCTGATILMRLRK